MTRPVLPLRAEGVEPGWSTLIDRYLGARHHAWRLRFAGIPPESPLEGVDVELVDTTGHPERPADTAMLWHLIWARDEATATVGIRAAGREASWPIAPGDTVPVPRGATLLATGGQLGLAIRAGGTTASSSPPSHGTDRFFGHNRQTIAAHLGGIRLCRWKLTQPLALAEHYHGPVLVMALARSAVIRTGSTIDHLRQGEIVYIDPATDPIITPDGLAYLLMLDRPRPH